ncbi:hypothetical protein MKEN_00727500 [Mycena kentingensis (nom. inval.)]|nr:hypothetical protein MKEN_00727500 [Mycena kentingensis (nom. inval.)]
MKLNSGCAAWIRINGHLTTELNPTLEDRYAECWLAAELGESFTVHVQIPEGAVPSDISARLYVDGALCGGKIIRQASLPQARVFSGVAQANGVSERKFVFGELKTTENEEDVFGPLGYPGIDMVLGTIEVSLVPIQNLVIVGHDANTGSTPDAAPFERKVPELQLYERSKLEVTQQVKLSPPSERQVPVSWVDTQISGPEIARFEFRYRPLEVLRAKGIVPNTKGLEREPSVVILDSDPAKAQAQSSFSSGPSTIAPSAIFPQAESKDKNKNKTNDLTDPGAAEMDIDNIIDVDALSETQVQPASEATPRRIKCKKRSDRSAATSPNRAAASGRRVPRPSGFGLALEAEMIDMTDL